MEHKKPEHLRVARSYAGLGLFTEVPIRKGVTVIEYIGHRVRTMETAKNLYIFNVNSRWDIDGSPRWNTARYINHSCRPNCEAINRRGRIFIVARKNIQAGEELTYGYGKDYFAFLKDSGGCRCEKCRAAK
jgi:uncharacterized protein